jgi:phage repressor protein C with HTH and peptisase S24 domain
MIYGVNKKVQKILEKFDLWRKSQGYSQQEIADAIGWDRSKVNRVLQGKQDSSYFLSRIEQVFGNIDEVKTEEVIRDDNYRLIRKFDTEASGGAGTLTTDENGETISVITEWLPKLPDQNLAFITVVGDSMSPLMGSGDTILVHMNSGFLGDGVYVLRLWESLHVKRVQRVAQDEYRIVSDNPIYKDLTITADDSDGFVIVGRVVRLVKAL